MTHKKNEPVQNDTVHNVHNNKNYAHTFFESNWFQSNENTWIWTEIIKYVSNTIIYNSLG